MADDLVVIHHGGRGERIRAFKAALNRRARARDLDDYVLKEDDVCDLLTLDAARKLAWALGARSTTYDAIVAKREIPVGVQRMIRNPGRRTAEQAARGKARISQMRADRSQRAKQRARVDHEHGFRDEYVENLLKAAANYRKNPSAYHYLAGGIANLQVFTPSPRNYRSDCSQFVSGIQAATGGKPLARAGALWVSTMSMDGYLQPTSNPTGADFGMYGPRGHTHHVEGYAKRPEAEFIGHGSPPIDSLTPGRPDFYLSNPGAAA